MGIQYFIQSKKAFKRLKVKDKPIEIEGFYKKKYKNRDKIAINEYILKKENNSFKKEKQTIDDVISAEKRKRSEQ